MGPALLLASLISFNEVFGDLKMAKLMIKDLRADETLDKQAMLDVRGGRMSFGWIRPFSRQSGAFPYNVFIGQIQVYNYTLINPVFNTVNQVEFINVDASDVVDSDVRISVSQGQNGAAG